MSTMADKQWEQMFHGRKILVYGALMNAHSAVKELETVFPGRVIGCAVTRMGSNPTEVCGKPVREIGAYEQLDKANVIVVIATMPMYFKEIAETLQQQGYLHICKYDGRLANRLFRDCTRRFLEERRQAEQEREEE